MPASLNTIAANAFLSCGRLTSVTLLGQNTIIKENAFSGCKQLRNVKYVGSEFQKDQMIRDSIISSTGNDALLQAEWHYYLGLPVIQLPEKLSAVDRFVLEDSGAMVIIIPQNCQSVAADAFANCRSLKVIVNRSSFTVSPPEGVVLINEHK